MDRHKIGGSFLTLREAAAYRAECMDPDMLAAGDPELARECAMMWAEEAAKIGESPWTDDDGEPVDGLHEATIEALEGRSR